MTTSSETRALGKHSPKELTHHISRASRKRVPNVLKEYYRLLRVPGMGGLAGGFPYSRYLPFDRIDVQAVASSSLKYDRSWEKDSITEAGSLPPLRIERASDQTNMFLKIDLDTALQYGTAQGFPPLYALIKSLVSSVYHPNIPYQGGADIIVTGGAADGLSKVYEILFNEWDENTNDRRDREGLLVDEFVYAPPIAQVKHKDVNIVPVKMDAEGMQADGPGGLFDILENWNEAHGKRPHVLYLIPTGQNPTSIVLSLPRRRRLYEICCRFDIIIIEDDPYWNLTYPKAGSLSEKYRTGSIISNFPGDPYHNYSVDSLKGSSTGYAFLDQLVPSFLSIDVDGRVVRLDTFSKTIAPGCRLGWITAQPEICEQLIRLTDATTQQPSGFVQAIVAQLLTFEKTTNGPNGVDKHGSAMTGTWGLDGWIGWLESLRDNYQRRMITMATIFEENRVLRTASGDVEMFSFHWPMGGMFLWLKLEFENHPLYGLVEAKRLMLALWIFCTQEPFRLLTNPGKDFAATETIREEKGHSYLRFCFAAVEEMILVAKTHAFVEACRQFWNMADVDNVNQILQEEDARITAATANGEDEDVERLVMGDE